MHICTWDSFPAFTAWAVRAASEAAVRAASEAAVRAASEAAVRAALEAAVRAASEAAVRAALEAAVRAASEAAGTGRRADKAPPGADRGGTICKMAQMELYSTED